MQDTFCFMVYTSENNNLRGTLATLMLSAHMNKVPPNARNMTND